tara:strand:- start:183 stop:629 length:447 start_codon:yes stop_codon:yes gene_type:complete
MNQEKYEKRLDFCKQAAENGYTPKEYLAVKKAADPISWVLDVGGKALTALKEVGATGVGLSAVGGAGLGLLGAYLYNGLRNEYPEKFVSSNTDDSALKEEKLRQLIARYEDASDKVRRQSAIYRDSQNPDKSPMNNYDPSEEFGGFGG